MVPVQFFLTRLVYTSTILIILCLMILIHLLTIKHRSPAAWYLIGFYLAIIASSVSMLFGNALLFWGYWLAPAQDAWLLVGAVALALFAYHFPNYDQPREARWVTLAFGMLALFTVGYSVIFAVRFFLTFSPDLLVPEAYFLLFPLATLLLVGIFLRRSIHYAPDQTGKGSRLHYAGLMVWRPQNREARSLRNFALALSLGLLPGLAFLSFIPDGISAFMLDLGSILVLGAIALVYLNNAPEPTSVIAKLVGISLVTFLLIFGAIGLQNLDRGLEQFQGLKNRDAELALRTILVNDLPAIPPSVAYVVAWSPEKATDGDAAQRLAYIRPAEPDLDLGALAEENRVRTGNPARPIESERNLSYPNNLLLRQADYPPAPISHAKYLAYLFVEKDATYEIGFSMLERHSFIHQTILDQFYWLLTGTLLIVLLLPILYRASLVTPLNKLLVGMKRVNRGDLKTRVPIQYEDEIGSITRSFNQMVESLHESISLRDEYYEELKKAHDEMEQRVAERTAELAASNEQLTIARDEAEAANKAKSTFLAHMSHELRTPLNAILGYTQLIKRDQRLPAEQQQRLTQVQVGGEHLLTLINDILDLSRVEAGKLQLRLSDYYLPGTLADIAELFKIRAEGKDLQFRYETAGLPDMVHGDATRLRQVLINLLANAIKFTAEGEVALRATRIETEEPAVDEPSQAARIQFAVEDTGIGIAENELEAIFEPFDQVYNPNQTMEGTGLGLTISRRLVEIMGGQLELESTPGKGSRFWFEVELPLVTESPLWLEEEKLAIVGFEGTQKKILIVDDIDSNRDLLMEMLSPLNFDLVDARCGEEGLAIAEDFQPDLILTDLVMPGMDGMEMMRQVRQLPGLEEVIVFAVSASAFPQEKERSIALGANAFFAKPVQFDRLLIALQSHLDLKPLYEEKQDGIAEMETAQSVPVAPPPDLAAAIVESARKGSITMLTEQIEQLEALGEQYRPLAGELRWLAGKYQFDAMVTLLEPFVVQKGES